MEPIKILNRLTKQKEPLQIKPLKIYTCGPTVYADSHLGHARTYIWVDIMTRVLKDYFGYTLITGMNITNIDDKIIAKALEEKSTHEEISKLYTQRFFQDMMALKVNLPNNVQTVTDNIDNIINSIQQIIDNGLAYEEKTGVIGKDGVYLDLTKFKAIGLDPCKFRTQEITEESDFVLWKVRDPSKDVGWKSKFGFGVPGWHIECTTLANLMFPSGFDIHCGGIDLAFPHHNNEIVQAEAIKKESGWVPYFIHIGHLNIDGLKMSKSLKNFIKIKDVLTKFTADQLRFYFLMHDYGSTLDFTESGLEYSNDLLKELQNFIKYTKKNLQGDLEYVENKLLRTSFDDYKKKVDLALRDDFNTTETIKLTRELISYVGYKQNNFIMQEILNYIVRLFNIYGVDLEPKQNTDQEKILDLLVSFRDQVRSFAVGIKKNKLDSGDIMKNLFALTDDLRNNKIKQLGYQIDDLDKDKSIWKSL